MGMSERRTFRSRNSPFGLSTSAIEFSWNLKNSIRKVIFREKNIFQAKNIFERKKLFFHEKSISGSIFQNCLKIGLRWWRGQMEHFYLLKLPRPDPLCERDWLNTGRPERKRESRKPAGKLLSSAAAALRVPAGGDQVDGLPPDCR